MVEHTHIFGKRLKQARIAAGLSLRVLGDKVNLSQTTIQKYENGQVFPSSPVLIKLTKAIGIPIEHLFRPESIEIGPISFRKKSTLLVKAQRKIEYQVRDKLERRLELENCYPNPPIKPFDYSRVPNTKISSQEDIEQVATQLRKAWKLGLAPIHDLIDVLENHGIRVIALDIDEDKFDGLFFKAGEKPVIVINKTWPGDRQRFTLAHELGHLIFNRNLPNHLKEESVCDRFAGALLFPKSAVVQEFGKIRSAVELRELLLVKQEYGLSMWGIVYRLRQSKVINETLFTQWCKRFSKNGWRQEEPGDELPPETAHVFEQLLFHALGEGYIGEAKAAELLNVSIDSFRQLRLVNG